MKTILTIMLFTLFASFSHAQNNYNNLWKQVEEKELKDLPKSALDIVTQIEVLAKKENNRPQLIKALIYRSKFALVLQEDAQLFIINDFKAEIAKSDTPTKNILQSLLANLYWQYYNQNRYNFYDRTKTSTKVDLEDFRTWDLETLFDETHFLFQQSLENGLILQQTPLKNYNDLLSTQLKSKLYRPTVFDFLSHNALGFYKTSETSITKPSYQFKIEDENFLSDYTVFSKLKLESKDTTSLQLHALKIYQDLIKSHAKSKSTLPLIDVNIERLKYVKQHAIFSNKDELYISALKKEIVNLKSTEAAGLYKFELASQYYEQGNFYQPATNDVHRWKTKQAFDLCSDVIREFPKSDAAEKCKILQSQILKQNLTVISENHIPIQENAKLLVTYQNIETLSLRIYPISFDKLEQFLQIHRQEEQITFIKSLDTYKVWEESLTNENDYQSHSTEILIPKLDNGLYLVVARVFNNESTFAHKVMQVTNLALVESDSADMSTFQVINRLNGKPIPEADVKLTYKKGYNSNLKSQKLTTNLKGEVVIKKPTKRYTNVNVEVTYKSEKAFFGDFYINGKRNTYDKNQDRYNGFLFTDRSIYRPGQTVYFKGIAMQTKDRKSTVFNDKKLSITFSDANRQEIKTLEFITNDFGSFQGEFIIPSTGLTGNYNLNISSAEVHLNGNANISVEEYKRPKFEAKFLPISETYQVNDSISVKGSALAYAGSSITGAKVVYRVHRNVQYPRWYYWHRPAYSSEAQNITFGETITNAKGEFTIRFKALPDDSVDKQNLPVFHYEVTADITDINGETRSATTTVNVGYHALIAQLSMDATLDKSDKSHTISIDCRNLNGEEIPASGHIKIQKLIPPNSVLRPRPWPAPDYQVLTKDAFKFIFPHESYDNESNITNWEKGVTVFDKQFNTDESNELALKSIKKWQSGNYIVELTSKDKFGQVVKDEFRTRVYSNSDTQPSDNEFFSINTNKETYQPNETVEIRLASAVDDMYVMVDIEKNQKIVANHVVHLDNSVRTIKIPVTKKDYGGFVVHISLAAYNSFKASTLNILVPYPSTELQIETLTFRDKLKPNAEETWNFKIKGPKGDKVSAELLASMYDASLDQFSAHQWAFNPIIRPNYYSRYGKSDGRSFGTGGFRIMNPIRFNHYLPHQQYDQFNWFGFYFGNSSRQIRFNSVNSEMDEVVITGYGIKRASRQEGVLGLLNATDESASYSRNMDEPDIGNFQDGDSRSKAYSEKKLNFDGVTIRKNQQETAFFFPQLQTDSEGNVSFSFTSPEALTKWKLQLLAHTKTLESSVSSFETVTKKELMVIPNAPRFLREGDEIVISSKIANLTDKQISGDAVLQLFDAVTGEAIDKKLFTEAEIPSPTYSGTFGHREFTIDANGNTSVSWVLHIPDDVQAVQYKVIAKTVDFSDGEQNILPVLSNRMLVTETLPMWIRSNQSKTFTLDKLKTHKSESLKHHKLTLEITSNPAWYAVQALPYLMEYPYECNEQTFSRYYANALASHIANSNPRIQEVFNQWKNTDALLSNLEKNEDLKSILIQETPWLRDAQSETEQKKRIALLFDLNKMTNELQATLRKLEQNQMGSGAWSWFNGGIESRYITQHIMAGFGHLKKLNVSIPDGNNDMMEKAIRYLDNEFVKHYKDIRKYDSKIDLNKDHLNHIQIHYLYMRSFFDDISMSKEVKEIQSYYHTQIKTYWTSRSLYGKGMMALITNRLDDSVTSNAILKSLKENSITSDELGMYWKSNTNSWNWYQAPIETQALLIEAFSEIEKNIETIDNLKIWLLKHKQTNRWKTTKATTEAVYALLLQGSDWLSVTEMVDVIIGGEIISPTKLEHVKVEAGTGYYKTSWNDDAISPKMSEVKLTKKGNGIAWGSLTWQYFEDLDQITSAETPLKLKKKLFVKKNTDKGEEITAITNDTDLDVGDLIRVRIELRVDRPMEFIHMKDMRAAGLEPVNVMSRYKWQDGLGYYESTKDASTNFFFDYLPKGVFVFEYDLRVNNAGDMSNGITTIQSMYAPEFSSHSEGVRVRIE